MGWGGGGGGRKERKTASPRFEISLSGHQPFLFLFFGVQLFSMNIPATE